MTNTDPNPEINHDRVVDLLDRLKPEQFRDKITELLCERMVQITAAVYEDARDHGDETPNSDTLSIALLTVPATLAAILPNLSGKIGQVMLDLGIPETVVPALVENSIETPMFNYSRPNGDSSAKTPVLKLVAAMNLSALKADFEHDLKVKRADLMEPLGC